MTAPLDLLLYALFGALGLALVASVLLPALLLRGRVRTGALAIVAVLWGVAYWTQIGKPDQALAWRGSTRQACESELAALPMSVPAQGLLDEGAALRQRSVRALLVDRGIPFIEVKVRSLPDGRNLIAYRDGDVDADWLVDRRAGYVRLALGKTSDPDCDLKMSANFRLADPPFLSGTCLRVTWVDQPAASMALVLSPASPDTRVAGRWQLVDRRAGTTIAALSSADTVESVSAGEVSAKGAQRFADCRSPHTVLADRIVAPAETPSRPDVLRQKELVFDKNQLKDAAGPRVAEAREERGADLTGPRRVLDPREWSEALAEAQRVGFATHQNKLIRWTAREVVTLRASDGYPWQSFPVADGFIVAPVSPSWYEASEPVIARFDAEGHLRWAVRVARPATLTGACHKFWPQTVTTSGADLVLTDACLTVEESQRGNVPPRVLHWKIPLSALPGPL